MSFWATSCDRRAWSRWTRSRRGELYKRGNADTSPMNLLTKRPADPARSGSWSQGGADTKRGSCCKACSPESRSCRQSCGHRRDSGQAVGYQDSGEAFPPHPKCDEGHRRDDFGVWAAGVSIAKGTTDGPSGIEFDPIPRKIVLDLA